MYELIKVAENSYYIDCPAKIGLYKLNDTEVVLIDSGSDKDAGKKVRKHLDENGWTLKAIYNTHSNADHIGGNEYLQSQTGCRIYAPGIECDFTNHPILEPSYLYGGYPFSALRHKFLLAKESRAEYLTAENLPEGLEAINLPGHFFDMVGFRTADDVVYLADCLSSRATLDKYGIGVLYDVAAYIDTLEAVRNMKAKLFIPSHAEPTEDINALAQYNIDKVKEVSDKITELCKEPLSFEAVLKKLFDFYGLTMTPQQYVLIGSTLRSYLSFLLDSGRLELKAENNMLLFKA